MSVLGLSGVAFAYETRRRPTEVLTDCSLRLEEGESLAVMGPSGSGKTTLLHCIAGLLTPSRGRIMVDEADMSALAHASRSDLRRHRIGMAFQASHLLPGLTAVDNVAVPLRLDGLPRRKSLEAARDALRAVGLEDRANHLPQELSGGEAQRVALARAIVRAPRLLLADEPTGNLDEATTRQVLDVLDELRTEYVASLLIATHDPIVAKRCGRRVRLEAGKTIED